MINGVKKIQMKKHSPFEMNEQNKLIHSFKMYREKQMNGISSTKWFLKKYLELSPEGVRLC